MGMKKIGMFHALMMMGAMMDPEYMELTEQRTGRTRNKAPIKQTPFNKSDGIVKMIKDYKEIKLGQSKKGVAKQNRIVSKIEGYVSQGLLTNEDIID